MKGYFNLSSASMDIGVCMGFAFGVFLGFRMG
jgi:hypothetical protein